MRIRSWTAALLASMAGAFSVTPSNAADIRGWALQPEVPVSDGEDEPVNGQLPLYFAFGPNGFMAIPDPKLGPPRARIVERFLGDSGESEKLQNPTNAVWDFSTIWASADGKWVFWPGERDGKTFLQVAEAGRARLVSELPLVKPATTADLATAPKGFAILDDRIYALGGATFPPELAPSFQPSTALAPQQTPWRSIASLDHAMRIPEIVASVRHAVDAPPANDDSRKAADSLRALLDIKPKPISMPDLVGDWKVRSIQGSPGSHYAYPFFKARIENLDGTFFFEKTTGSQRRSGLLHPDTANRWIFLGGLTMNDDPQLGYSGGTKDSDSFGTLHLLNTNHAILILDVSTEGDYEVYELKR